MAKNVYYYTNTHICNENETTIVKQTWRYYSEMNTEN